MGDHCPSPVMPQSFLHPSMSSAPPSSLPLPAAFHLLSAGAWAERFTLHAATGELRTATVLRRSDRAEYIFTVTASDRGTVPRSTSAIIRVQVSSTPAPCTIHSLLISWRTPFSYLAAFLHTLLALHHLHPRAPSALAQLLLRPHHCGAEYGMGRD